MSRFWLHLNLKCHARVCMSACFPAFRAFEEYYEGPTEFSSGVLEGIGVLKSTWRRAIQNGVVEEADVQQLTDWYGRCLCVLLCSYCCRVTIRFSVCVKQLHVREQ